MPFRSQAQRKFLFAKKPAIAAEFASKTPKGAKLPEHVKKMKRKKGIFVNNKLKEYGNEEKGRIEINVKKHKGDKAELADTIKHEILHRKHPKSSEKSIQKKTQVDMSKMSYSEKEALTKKLRHKTLNYKGGVLKRKFKMSAGKVAPGAYIQAMNSAKVQRKTNQAKTSNFKLGVEALI